MNLHEVLSAQAEVVVIGIAGRYDDALYDFDASEVYDVQPFESTYSAYRYLQEKGNEELTIQAIVCDVQTLMREDYLFVHNIRRDAGYRNTPIIGIDRTGDQPSTEVLANGVDDCFIAPVSWEVLRTRINDILAFKEMLKESGEVPVVEDRYAIPRGKRIFDIAFSLGALAFWALPMLFIAIAIKLSSKGPVFYTSKRIGTGYNEFGFLKFRSMVPDADKLVESLRANNQYGADGAFFKMKNDPRVTKIGRFIRNTSLDELPQLINVLKGDMSIVGNRPLPLGEAETLTSEEWSERFLAPAGITGKWQTSGRGKDTMDTDSRMALDIEYARDYSPMMDLKILFKTFGAMKQDANV
ncbi:MAG: sugar transferase [Saprospiraceae bacterium]